MSIAAQRADEASHASANAPFDPQSILAAARRAAQQRGLEYAGDVTPQEAWALLCSGAVALVDVRTRQELQRTGHVPGAGHVEWLTGPGMSKNLHFIDELESVAGKEETVLFLCRSGKRSVAAAEAATCNGFGYAFNVREGFEGNGSPHQGWLNHGLPSAQG